MVFTVLTLTRSACLLLFECIYSSCVSVVSLGMSSVVVQRNIACDSHSCFIWALIISSTWFTQLHVVMSTSQQEPHGPVVHLDLNGHHLGPHAIASALPIFFLPALLYTLCPPHELPTSPIMSSRRRKSRSRSRIRGLWSEASSPFRQLKASLSS